MECLPGPPNPSHLYKFGIGMIWLASLVVLAATAFSKTEEKFRAVEVDHTFASRAYGTGDYFCF